MNSTNKQLGQIFSDMAKMYSFLNEKDRFRTIAYNNAAQTIGNLENDLNNCTESELESIKGIGHGIATKIEEFLATGKIEKYEELKTQVPVGLIRLINVKGFGPKTLKTLHEKLGINNKEDLVKALNDDRIINLKGFGKKKIDNMFKGMELYKASEERILLWDALEIGNKIIEEFKQLKSVIKIELAGSVRRRKETIGDLDILVSCTIENRTKVIDHLVLHPMVTKVLAKGDKKVSVIIKDRNRQLDLRVVLPEEWGAALIYFTGSKQHNVHIRTIAKDQNLKVSEYGVFNNKTFDRIAGKTEEEVYKSLGMKWMPPEIREDSGEIEAAINGNIPQLIQNEDIIGDLQMHSTWTDGKYSIEEIVTFIKKNYNYQYIAITDHSKAVRVAHGLDEDKLQKQLEEISKINKKLGEEFIKTGIEVDINMDGTLDLSSEILSRLDWVVASIHTGFNQDNTERIIKACKNPNVNVIGHPTGRLIGSRDAYTVNIEKVITAARITGTALEINAQPERMDLNAQFAKMAWEQDVKLVISTDSHTLSNFAYMQLGVSIARKAWCKKENILNTMKWNEIEKFFNKKKDAFKMISTH